MPEWNDLTDAERQTIIAAVFHDGQWDAQIALDVYNAIRRVIGGRQ